MNRILIFGLNGSGKSTLAKKLGEILGLEVIHLDKYFFKQKWEAVSREERDEIIKNILLKDKWIMDGTYPSSLDRRMEAADTIIFLNFNRFLCLYRAFKRIFNRTQPTDKAPGNFHKISWELIRKIFKYPKKKMLDKLEFYKKTKQIFVFRNRKEVENYLNILKH